MAEIRFAARILRKQDNLPRYIVVPPELVSGRDAAFEAEVQLGEARPFPRKIHPWGKGSDVFFFNLTAPQCKAAGLDTGDKTEVVIIPLN